MDQQLGKSNISEALEYIDPSMLDYQQWVNVGMALKEEGFGVDVWDAWSRRDIGRYHAGECDKKWDSFSGGFDAKVTAGTIVQYAKEHGWEPSYYTEDREIDWDDVIADRDDLEVINPAWVEDKEVAEPDSWKPADQLIKYLETLFEASENVGYVTGTWEKDGKFLPNKGNYDRTAGELIQLLNKNKKDIGAIIGDYNQQAGAWIRFNPLDGKGVKNENVTDYRFALVESDEMEIEKQNAIIRDLELPVACLVHSGGKSLHAIVRVDAGNYDEYRKRVDYLYNVCRKNGLKVDSQNRNPSRLSRMPGIIRNGNKQYLVDTNIGKESWHEWKEWIESINDNLPDSENLADVWDNLPELSPPLIDGVLRQGHKMLLAGPSKAGKSYMLIELCIAIAEGKKWLTWNCAKGKVLYVNLELDKASCLHRFADVYRVLSWAPENLQNIDIWNLRGQSIPMDKLAPKLIRRAAKKGYIAIMIDPIYKVITGDENSADQMANFCNQFDKVCNDLGAAVIYCHHHSKGDQGHKRSMDRASGSGVFARDPDALIDVIELEVTEEMLTNKTNEESVQVCINALEENCKTAWEDRVSQDDLCSSKAMLKHAITMLPEPKFRALQSKIAAKGKYVDTFTAWRIEGTFREFPKMSPINIWFTHPVHQVDEIGVLKDVDAEGEAPPWKKAIKSRKPKEEKQLSRKMELETAINLCVFDEEQVTIEALSEYLDKTKKTVRNWVMEHGGYKIEDGFVRKK